MKYNITSWIVCGVLSIFIASCTNNMLGDDPIASDVQNQNIQTRTTLMASRVISKIEAKTFAQSVYDAILRSERPGSKESRLSPLLSSFTPKVSSVFPVINDGLATIYVVNFGEQKGFAVISADKYAGWSLLAFNDTGFLNPDNLDSNNPFSLWLKGKSDMILQTLKKEPSFSEKTKGDDIWGGFSNPAPGEETIVEYIGQEQTTAEQSDMHGHHKGSKGLAAIGVYSTIRDCLWGQGTGYNANALHPGVDLAGCPAVAIGLYCKTKRFPNKYDYNNMPNTLSSSSPNPISIMLRDIADNIPNYHWGTRASGASPNDCHQGLLNLGFTKAKMGSYNFDIVYSNIKNLYPVLLAAFRPNGGGHIWICDGYWEQKWKITRKFLWWKIKTWYEYSDMLYMNWGWNGSGNSWIDQEDWPNYSIQRTMYYDLHN